MGRRVLAFFLGMLFGIIFIVGAVAGAIYIAVCVVKVNKYVPESDKYLGTMANMSVYDIGKSVYDLYMSQAGLTDEEGNYFTLGQFLDKYEIDLQASLGMTLPEDLLTIPAFEFFRDGGAERAMKQIKVSSIPAIINMFGDENGMFGETVIAELSKYSVADLFSEEVGFSGVFARVKLADVMPDAFPAEDSDNKLMWAVGQTTVGGVLDGVSGSDSILLQLKAGNAFEAVGALEISSVLGDNEYVNAILGNGAKVADLIGDNGNIRLDEIINGISIGDLLGCQKNEITDTTGYVGIEGQDPNADVLVMQKGEAAKAVYIKTSNGEEWFEAELDCDEEHVHTAECYPYVWYSTSACNNNSSEHHHDFDDMYKDGTYYPRVTGLYAVLSALSVTDLTTGNDDALMEKIKVLKVSDIISGVDISGVMSALVDLTIENLMSGAIDDLYLGDFFQFDRKIVADLSNYDESTLVDVYKKSDTKVIAFSVMTNANGGVVMSTDKQKWYEGLLDCDEEHTHNHDCYRFVWVDDKGAKAEGIQAKLSSKQISDLKNLNDEVKKLTLRDVFGDDIPKMLITIADTKISNLQDDIDRIMLGELLEYSYVLDCKDPENDQHEHDYDCYVWTNKNNEPVDGMMAKLAHKQVGDMSDLQNTIKSFTLKDVLGDDIPDMLKSLADAEIGDFNDSIKKMFLGDFLEYTHKIICGQEDDDEHEHDYKCYVWTDKNGNEVVGMMAKLAVTRVNELSDLQATVKTFTLKDVLGNDVPNILKDVENTQINDLRSAIDNLYLGSAMDYERKEVNMAETISILIVGAPSPLPHIRRKAEKVEGFSSPMPVTPAEYYKSEDGKVWYEAVLNCDKNHSDHDADCYEYVWYEKGTANTDQPVPVSGVAKAFVNRKLSNVSETMNTLTIKELGIDSDGNTILQSIEDVPIMEIGSHINDIKMGKVLGYVQYYTCENDEDTEHKHTDDCEYIWLEECTDNHDTSKPNNHFETETHYTVNEKKYVEVKGLNAKIAVKTIKQMTGNGMSEISQSLTIGDLIDSGMMSLGDTDEKRTQNEYKFAIVFCGEETHKFDKEIPGIPGISGGLIETKTYGCTLPDYLTYIAAYENTTAQEYWMMCHKKTSEDELSEEEIEHRDSWKELLLSEFISQLLNAF